MHSWSCSFFTVGSRSSSTNILFHPFVILTGLLIDIKSILLFFIHVHVYIWLSKKEKKTKSLSNFFFLQNGFRKIVVEISFFFSKRKKNNFLLHFLPLKLQNNTRKKKTNKHSKMSETFY